MFCDICQGSGTVRLPVWKRPVTVSPAFCEIEEDVRAYPCPECAPKFTQEQITALDLHSVVDMRRFGELPTHERLSIIRRELTRRLADHLAASNAVRYREGKPDRSGAVPIYSTLYVVAPKHVATLEERLVARQTEIASKVVDEALHRVDVWGSFYARQMLTKEEARRFIREALAEVIRRETPEGGRNGKHANAKV